MDLRLYALREDDFDSIIALGDKVHGEGYLTHTSLEDIYRRSCSRGKCCSYVMYDRPRDKGKLVGFRLTYAPGQWGVDEWCSPSSWGIDPEKVCYFKSNTIDPEYQGKGIGSHLLNVSTQVVQGLGGEAGVAHIWLGSPGNSAFRYFVKNGAKLIWIWPNRWTKSLVEKGSKCSRCGDRCNCSAAEMILHFGGQDQNE